MAQRIALALLCGALLFGAAALCVRDLLRVEQLVAARGRPAEPAAQPVPGPEHERPWALHTPPPHDLRALRELRELHGPVELPHYVPFAPLGDLDAPAQKQVDKLAKKLAKKQAKLAGQQGKLDELQLDLDALHAALAAAEALPTGTPAEQKAAAKAVKKASKQLGKQLARVDKLQDKMVQTTEAVGELVVDLETLDPGHTAAEPIEGLAVPEALGLVLAGLSGTQGGPQGDAGGPDEVPDFPPDADYFADAAVTRTWDAGAAPLAFVNELLSALALTAHDALVNRGAYHALVDTTRCALRGDTRAASAPRGQSAGADAGELSLWTVSSARGSNDSLQVVRLWAPRPAQTVPAGPSPYVTGTAVDVPAGTLHGKLVVSAAPTPENPFGELRLDYALLAAGDAPGKPTLRGHLSTQIVEPGLVGFRLFEEHGDVDAPGDGYARSVAAHVQLATDQGSGSARVRLRWRPPAGTVLDALPPEPADAAGVFTEEHVVAFDEEHVRRAHTGAQASCFDRNDFRVTGLRYSLYHAEGEQAGERVTLEDGSLFRTVDGVLGWADRHGLWLAGDEPPAGGVAVERLGAGAQPGEPYTTFVAPGRLLRHERQAIPLATLDGMRFEWLDVDGALGDGGVPGPATFGVAWDHAGGVFAKVSRWVPERGVGQWFELPSPSPVDVLAEGGALQLWAAALGGPAYYEHGASELVTWSTEPVDGDDALFTGGDAVPLFAYVGALRAGLTAAEAEAADVFHPVPGEIAAPWLYVFDRSTLTLVDATSQEPGPAGLAPGEAPASGPYTWGLRSGPMVADTTGLAEVDDVWDADVVYTWETGPHPWNRFGALVDGEGAFLRFDGPAAFGYVHSADADANEDATWSDTSLVLRYGAPGELRGIPSAPVDLDDDGVADRFDPLFTLADGALLGAVGDEYVAKATALELDLMPLESGCESIALDAAAALPLPDGSDWTKPDAGPAPAPDDPPAVIDGVVQPQS